MDESVVSGLPSRAPTELWRLLERREWSQAAKRVQATYDILSQMHGSGRFENFDYISHYRPYLRLDDQDEGWPERLQTVLGNSDKVSAYGVAVKNPLTVLAKLEDAPQKCTGTGKVGAIHGDLHPRNVLVGDVLNACLIDFGWASDRAHVIIDFVLMEISIKFFYMPWHVSRRSLLEYEGLLTQGLQVHSGVDDPILDGSLQVLAVIRKLARDHISKPDDGCCFASQYLLPLFLVTMGTFKFAARVTNLEHLILSAGLIGAQVEQALSI